MVFLHGVTDSWRSLEPVLPHLPGLEDTVAGELSRITAPTLIAWGARDALCSRRNEDALLAAITGSRCTKMRGTPFTGRSPSASRRIWWRLSTAWAKAKGRVSGTVTRGSHP